MFQNTFYASEPPARLVYHTSSRIWGVMSLVRCVAGISQRHTTAHTGNDGTIKLEI